MTVFLTLISGNLLMGDGIRRDTGKSSRAHCGGKTGVAVQVNKPLYTWGFTAGEICTCGIAFLCDAQMDEVILAEELRDSKWVPKAKLLR